MSACTNSKRTLILYKADDRLMSFFCSTKKEQRAILVFFFYALNLNNIYKKSYLFMQQFSSFVQKSSSNSSVP